MVVEVNDFYIRASDRWIRVERNEHGIVGINFTQGDDYMIFDEAMCAGRNLSLTKFYLAIKENFDSHLGFRPEVDQIIWLWLMGEELA